MWDMTAAESAQPTATSRVPQWTFADRMRKVRTDILDLHQHQMAKELGVTKAAYAAWESGRTQPRDILALARRVELVSRVPAAWLLGVDQVTDTYTPRFSPASRTGTTTLSLVPNLEDTNRNVSIRNGSWPPDDGCSSGRTDLLSSGMVNHADAA